MEFGEQHTGSLSHCDGTGFESGPFEVMNSDWPCVYPSASINARRGLSPGLVTERQRCMRPGDIIQSGRKLFNYASDAYEYDDVCLRSGDGRQTV